ncbi:MAG: dockerin type I repeat-containing protein [Phycisphaeraceae bacterium]
MDEPHENLFDRDHEADPARDETLQRDLNARYGRQPLVPPAVDETVLAEARSHFAAVHQARARQRWRLAGAGIAAAALLAVSVWLIGPLAFDAAAPVGQAQRSGDVPGEPGDMNGDGVVDVLDMLVLARELEAGMAPPSHADVTGDGDVTFDDLHALGQQIVALPPVDDEEPRL